MEMKYQMLKPYFANEADFSKFDKRSDKLKCTLRSKNHIIWLIEISDGLMTMKPGRYALGVVFLITIAENIINLLFSLKGSRARVNMFFDHISDTDRSKLLNGIKRVDSNGITHDFRLPTIIDILYNMRNRMIHEGIYYETSLNEKTNDFNFSVMTWGYRYRRKMGRGYCQTVHLDIGLTYQELKDIFIYTALRNIELRQAKS